MNTPKVRLTLVGLDGNAFALLGAFQHAARRQGWTPDAIKKVMDDATAGDYNHLLRVLMDNTTEDDNDDDGEAA